MATTTRGYRYPIGSAAPNVPADLANLASDLDADVDAIAGNTSGRPLVRLVQQVAQSLPHNTDTEILFASGSEEIDTHNFHSTASNTSRITPTKAGHYRFTGTVIIPANTTLILLVATIAKNGTPVAPRVRQKASTNSNSAGSTQVSAIQACNGSGDYFELLGLQQNTGSTALNTSAGLSFSSVFEAEYLRPL